VVAVCGPIAESPRQAATTRSQPPKASLRRSQTVSSVLLEVLTHGAYESVDREWLCEPVANGIDEESPKLLTWGLFMERMTGIEPAL
jgi:hypothetical protein